MNLIVLYWCPETGNWLSVFALEYIIKKVQEHQAGLKLNRTYQLLVYADDINLLGDKINTIKENKEPTIYTVCREYLLMLKI